MPANNIFAALDFLPDHLCSSTGAPTANPAGLFMLCKVFNYYSKCESSVWLYAYVSITFTPDLEISLQMITHMSSSYIVHVATRKLGMQSKFHRSVVYQGVELATLACFYAFSASHT